MFPTLIALIVALLPTYQIRFQIFGIPMTFLEVMILLVFMVWATTSLRAKRIDRSHPLGDHPKGDNLTIKIPTPLLIITSIFLLSAFIAIFIAPYGHRAALGIFKAYFIEPILLVIVAINTIKTKKDIEKIIFGFAISAFYISLYAIFQKFTGYSIPGPWILERRVTSVFPYPNAIGLYLAPLIPLFIGVIASKAKQSSEIATTHIKARFSITFFIIVTLLSLIAIYFAKTEAALGTIGIVLLVWLFISKIRFAKPISISIGAISLITIFITPNLREKLLLQDWSGTVRRITWNETWTMLKDRPVFGAGLSGYPNTFRPYHHRSFEIFQYPHNVILNFWSEIGLVGLLAFFGLIIWFFISCHPERSVAKSKDPPHNQRNFIFTQSLTAAMIILLLHGLVDVPYFKNDLAIIFWFLFVLLLAHKKTIEPYH